MTRNYEILLTQARNGDWFARIRWGNGSEMLTSDREDPALVLHEAGRYIQMQVAQEAYPPYKEAPHPICSVSGRRCVCKGGPCVHVDGA